MGEGPKSKKPNQSATSSVQQLVCPQHSNTLAVRVHWAPSAATTLGFQRSPAKPAAGGRADTRGPAWPSRSSLWQALVFFASVPSLLKGQTQMALLCSAGSSGDKSLPCWRLGRPWGLNSPPQNLACSLFSLNTVYKELFTNSPRKGRP